MEVIEHPASPLVVLVRHVSYHVVSLVLSYVMSCHVSSFYVKSNVMTHVLVRYDVRHVLNEDLGLDFASFQIGQKRRRFHLLDEPVVCPSELTPGG